jgi:hypothetical protein
MTWNYFRKTGVRMKDYYQQEVAQSDLAGNLEHCPASTDIDQ